MARSCIFCGSAGPLSNEHIFPKWLLTEIRGRGLSPVGDQRATFEITDPDANFVGLSSSEKPLSPHGEMISRSVCQLCNNGWMDKNLEREFSGVYRSLVHGRLDEIHHSNLKDLIARWAVKTAMVFDASIGKDLYYSQSDRETLMQGALPPNTDVQMGILTTTATSVDSSAMLMGHTKDGHPILGSIETVYAGPLMFMIRRSTPGQHLLRLLTATEHFGQHWMGIHDVLPSRRSVRPLSQSEIEEFLDRPGAAK